MDTVPAGNVFDLLRRPVQFLDIPANDLSFLWAAQNVFASAVLPSFPVIPFRLRGTIFLPLLPVPPQFSTDCGPRPSQFPGYLTIILTLSMHQI